MAENDVTEIEIEGSVDAHFHFRDSEDAGDGRMEMLIEKSGVFDEHEVIIGIGNTAKPVLNQWDASTYLYHLRQRIPAGKSVTVMVAPLLTDRTVPTMIHEMRRFKEHDVAFTKAFMAGVSNDFGNSVSDVKAIIPVLHAHHDEYEGHRRLICHWHMERKFDELGNVIHMLDREWYAVDHDMRLILELDPEGEHVIKHVTDVRTIVQARMWRKQGYKIWVELAPHYFVRNFEDLFEGPGRKGTAFNANDLCWPLYKHSDSTKAIIDLATFADPEDPLAPYVLFGTDCAMWFDDPTQEKGVKITCDGIVCGGTTILPAVSKSIIIDTFVERGKAHLLDEFFSRRSRALLGLPPARTKVLYRRQDWEIPNLLTREHSKTGQEFKVRPFMRGEFAKWKRDSVRVL